MPATSDAGLARPLLHDPARDVWDGLGRAQKEISPAFFYDERGSALFDQITALPEYYPTRAERAILERLAPALIETLNPKTVVELGPGNGDKARLLLRPLVQRQPQPWYVPIDVSATYLDRLAARFALEFPSLVVCGSESDIAHELRLPPGMPAPLLIAFLGSTIGNFDAQAGAALLARIAAVMRAGDRALIGFDLKKDAARLERAYNDQAGVTAEFNLNALRVLNRELDCEFDPGAFEHYAFYDQAAGRVEMHLRATCAMTVRIGGHGSIALAQGETIRTEISCKYDRPQIESMLREGGLRLERFETGADADFALVLASAA